MRHYAEKLLQSIDNSFAHKIILSKPQCNIPQARRQHDRKEMKKKSWIISRSKKILALYYWGKLLGINPLSLSKKNKLKFSYISLLYGCFLAMMHCHVYYQLVIARFSTSVHEESPIAIVVDFLGISSQFLETSLGWFVFAIHQNRVKIIIKSFVTAGKTSVKLGIPDNWDKSFKEFGTHVLFHNILFLVSVFLSYWMWGLVNGTNSFFRIKFDLPVIPSFNAKITFIWCLILVRRKFRQLNESIEFLMENTCPKRNGLDQRLIRHSSCDSDRLLDRINMISQLHRELRDIIHCIEKHFALFTLFSIATRFTYCTLNVYRMYIYMRGHPRRAIELAYLGALHHWVIYPAVLLGVISYVCGSTLNEANNTGCVLHELITKSKCFHDTPQAAKWNALSLDLLKNRANMSVYGFFELDHFLFHRTVATAATYLTIMLQLYN